MKVYRKGHWPIVLSSSLFTPGPKIGSGDSSSADDVKQDDYDSEHQ